MVASNAREVLANENKLLEEMIELARTYSQQGGVAATVFDGWVNGLTRHRDINLKLIDDADAAFDQEIDEEINLLEGVVATLKGGGAVTKSWIDHLQDDITLLKMLR